MRARPPTPMRRATKPSATGPTPPSANPPGFCRVLEPAADVRGDVGHLGVGQVAREARHVGRPGADRLGNLLRGHLAVLQRRGVGAEGQRVSGSLNGVAGGAVEGEQVLPDRLVGPAQVRIGHGGDGGVEGVDPGGELQRLHGGQPGRLALGLDRLDVGGGHAARADPEVDRGGADALQVRPDGGLAVGAHAVGLVAVAARAGLGEQEAAGGNEGLRGVGVGDGRVAVGDQVTVEACLRVAEEGVPGIGHRVGDALDVDRAARTGGDVGRVDRDLRRVRVPTGAREGAREEHRQRRQGGHGEKARRNRNRLLIVFLCGARTPRMPT